MLVLLVCLVALTVDSAFGKACDRGENGKKWEEMKKNMSPEEIKKMEEMKAKYTAAHKMCQELETVKNECKMHCIANATGKCDPSGKPTSFGPMQASQSCKQMAEECASKKIAEDKVTDECKVFNIHMACYKDKESCPKESFTWTGKDGPENAEKKE